MKAFLLAAGLGSRLRPLTDTTPKCLLDIGGRPLLDIWLDALAAAGVDEVLVNTHHLADAVRAHLGARPGVPCVRTSFEPDLLGSAGTLLAHRDWVAGEELFLACYADNLTDWDLNILVDFHRGARAIASLGAFRSDNPAACGIMRLDGANRVTGYVEKPKRPMGNLANAGIYAFHPDVLKEIDAPPPSDIGYHLLPRLVGRARAIVVDGYLRDIGTPDAYLQAQQEWREKAAR